MKEAKSFQGEEKNNPVPVSILIFWVLYLLILATGLWFIYRYPKDQTFLWINSHHAPAADILFRYFTFLGDGLFYVILVLFFLFFNRANGYTGLWGFAASSLGAQFIKRLVFPGAPRPIAFLKDPSLIHFVEGVKIHSAGSFPSGHTATAFSIALWLSCYFKNPLVSVLSLVLATGVAYSRVYLAQHFLEDVVGGSVVGILTTWLVIRFLPTKKSKA